MSRFRLGDPNKSRKEIKALKNDIKTGDQKYIVPNHFVTPTGIMLKFLVSGKPTGNGITINPPAQQTTINIGNGASYIAGSIGNGASFILGSNNTSQKDTSTTTYGGSASNVDAKKRKARPGSFAPSKTSRSEALKEIIEIDMSDEEGDTTNEKIEELKERIMKDEKKHISWTVQKQEEALALQAKLQKAGKSYGEIVAHLQGVYDVNMKSNMIRFAELKAERESGFLHADKRRVNDDFIRDVM